MKLLIAKLFAASLIGLTLWVKPYEALQVVSHYIFGKGKPLELRSSYIHKSPVILRNLRTMKVGESRKVSFVQKEDWRLSYAINGFTLKKTKTGFEIRQYIKFDNTGKVYTNINTPLGNVKVYDSWVHLLNCTPYTLRYYYSSGSLY